MSAALLQEARAAIAGRETSTGIRVLPRRDGALAIAFLVTVARKDGDLVVPLRQGRNMVGRGSGETGPYGPWPRPYAIEQAQWIIDCKGRHAEVMDAASTNPGYLNDIELPHANAKAAQHRYPLHEGDVLRGAYATFVFGWV